MDWSLRNPYEVVGSADGLSYFFVTDSGHHYRAYFLEMRSYVPSFQNVFAFNLEPVEYSPHPPDRRIAATVAFIVSCFFNHVENGLLYICDTSDGKGLFRKRLFDYWFRIYNDGRAVKFDAESQTPDCHISSSRILLKENKAGDKIVRDYYALVANGMIPE